MLSMHRIRPLLWSALTLWWLSGGASTAFAQAPAPASPAPAWAQGPVWVNIGGFSRHFVRGKGYNENNLGLGLELRTSGEVSLMAGYYVNSMRRDTQYAAVNWQPWTLGDWRLGVAVGVMNGYPAVARGGTFFAALPMASYEGARFGVNVGLIPSIKDVDGALLVQFKMRLR